MPAVMPKARSAPRSTAGRPRRFTHEQIVQAALAVMQRAGFAGLSVRSLGDELGVSNSLLYNYFDHIEEIEAEAIQRLAADLPMPRPGTPRELREQLVRSLFAGRELLLRHPGVSHPPLGSTAWRTFSEWVIQWVLALTPFAASQAAAASGHTALISVMAMSAERQRSYGPDYRKKAEPLRDRRVQVPKDLRGVIDLLIDGLFPGLPKSSRSSA